MTAASEYVGAYPFLNERAYVWKEIARYVQRDVPNADVVVEMGPGYCDFINAFPARRKLAFDLNPQMADFADDDVELRIQDARRLADLEPGSVDLIFASNFLEHLGESDVAAFLTNSRQALSDRGRLILLQPNHRLCAEHYFDDPTHRTIFDDVNIHDWLGEHQLRAVRVVKRLLPFSMESRLPKWPLLVRMYLNSPVRPLGAQMYVVAERA